MRVVSHFAVVIDSDQLIFALNVCEANANIHIVGRMYALFVDRLKDFIIV